MQRMPKYSETRHKFDQIKNEEKVKGSLRKGQNISPKRPPKKGIHQHSHSTMKKLKVAGATEIRVSWYIRHFVDIKKYVYYFTFHLLNVKEESIILAAGERAGS